MNPYVSEIKEEMHGLPRYIPKHIRLRVAHSIICRSVAGYEHDDRLGLEMRRVNNALTEIEENIREETVYERA